MSEKKKKIPCRVCGKLFTPCAYCQSNADEFRWRNFACSMKCAKKYIDDTIAYRAGLNNERKPAVKEKTKTDFTGKTATVKEKINNNDSLGAVENTAKEAIKNIKTE
jgi:hypothetical protein